MRLELREISKRFPGVLANDKISISADRGKVLGLLGENGAGKTTLMNILSGLYKPDSGQIFIDGEEKVFGDPAALTRLEGIVHPLVRAAERRFLGHCAAHGRPLVVLDIPLLFETGGERRVDAVAVVSAPAFLQEQRALRRPGMDRARLAAVRARQTPDAEKRRRADFVIPTGLGRRPMLDAIGRIVATLRGRRRGAGWENRTGGMRTE